MKDDDKAFIFTLKNPHGVEPTIFKKRKESNKAIECNFYHGPSFGNDDICIIDKCNIENSCIIGNDGTNGYECHSVYTKSLFVNSIRFTVLDYEVFTFY